jgi:hypothetical protein
MTTDKDPRISRHYIGPTPPVGSICGCGHPAAAQCEGCKRCFCGPCWWKHSHTKEREVR